MHTAILMLALTISGQLGSDRYPAAGEAADQQTGTAEVSQIVIADETPQPTLVDETPTAAATAAESPSAAAAGDEAGAAAGGEEASVLVAVPKPADLMRTLLQPPVSALLPGTPITLGDALRGASTRSQQGERAHAYWQLAAATAHYYLAVLEAGELASLRQGIAAPSPDWESAERDAATRVAQTRRTATSAQMLLHRLMGSSAGPSLPLPADAPHCGRYNTRYDEIFAGRSDPLAKQINDMLPELYAELVAETRQVAQAHDWLTFVAEHRDPANDGTGLLRAYELMTVRRRAFIDSVRQYNDQIAVYSHLAAPDDLGSDRLVAMLIRTSLTDPAAAGGDVQPAAALEEATSA
ncbi:MAG TPA: hypothetical protein PJ982_15245, partial [Lacipirellulaceae bacterium]|nr:hypothetical protein [Lacipirellulaceae bacterium]